jgi:mono/diheme cytochrome c family protein
LGETKNGSVLMNSNLDPHNKGGMYAFVGSVIFCVLFFIYIGFINKGVEGVDEIYKNQGGAQGPNLAAIAKPWEENADIVDHGATVFKNNCAVCHGEKGGGDGPGGAALNPKPRNMIEGQWKHGGKSEELYTTITNGFAPGSAMAPFGHLSKLDRWSLVQFVRSITKNKVKDDPAALDKFAATAK